VEEAQGLLKLCDQFKVERDDLKTQIGLKPPSMGADGKYRYNCRHPVPYSVAFPPVFRIRSGSGFNQVSGSGCGSRRAKIEVLNVLFRWLKASSVVWTSFMEA
jgi:hypothetical protein